MLHLRTQRGFTLVEAAIIVLTMAILAAILVPNLGRLNALARFVKVKEDLMVICTAMKMYLDDTGESQFYFEGNDGRDTPARQLSNRDQNVGLLIGDGDVPDLDADPAGKKWRTAIDKTFKERSDVENNNILFGVDTFANHLIQNQPDDHPGDHYRTPQEMLTGERSSRVNNGLHFDPSDGDGFNSLFAWRGPYINDRVYPDPWGNRYASNVFALDIPDGDSSDGFNSAVVCYSAGPDEAVDTAFNQKQGWITGDDDQTVILNSGNW